MKFNHAPEPVKGSEFMTGLAGVILEQQKAAPKITAEQLAPKLQMLVMDAALVSIDDPDAFPDIEIMDKAFRFAIDATVMQLPTIEAGMLAAERYRKMRRRVVALTGASVLGIFALTEGLLATQQHSSQATSRIPAVSGKPSPGLGTPNVFSGASNTTSGSATSGVAVISNTNPSKISTTVSNNNNVSVTMNGVPDVSVSN